MPNSVISQIVLPSGTTYDIKDAAARAAIDALEKYTVFLGVTTTPLVDGSTTNPIVVDGKDVTAIAGAVATYGSAEFIFNGTSWQEFGDLSGLGSLAYKSSATGNFTPSGTVSQPTFSNGSVSASGNFTPSGSVSVSTKTTANQTADVSAAQSGTATYTPAGSVSAPTISVSSAGSTTTVNSITAVGTLPSWSGTVSGETLTFSWSAGTLPTKGDNQTVKTGDASYTATAPSFTGTGVHLVTGNIAVPDTYEASFSGTQGSVSVSGSATGTVSQPTFTGTQGSVTVS